MEIENNLWNISANSGDILVVDDDSSSLFLVQDLLSSMGMAEKVTTTTNVESAMDLLLNRVGTSRFPSYIILDIKMPEIDGFGFLEQLESFPFAGQTKPKIILLSYYGNRIYQEKADYYGVSAYLRKPLTREKVLEVLV